MYDLLAPATHSFDIVYDVTRPVRERYFFNPIRVGSVATKERVIDRATGKPLEFETVDGKSAKAEGCQPRTADNAEFLRVKLHAPCPRARNPAYGSTNVHRPSSYYEKDGGFVFDRPRDQAQRRDPAEGI